MSVPIWALVNVDAFAPTIFVKVELSGDDCHCIVPVFPANVILAGEIPEQIVWLEEAVPPTLVGLTVTANALDVPFPQVFEGVT